MGFVRVVKKLGINIILNVGHNDLKLNFYPRIN